MLTTTRLCIRPFTVDDAAFIVALVNDPDWVRYIGPRDVADAAAAETYLQQGPIAMQARLGYALWAVELLATGRTVGMCGLLQREPGSDTEIGFAFLPEGRGQGLALEAAQACMAHGFGELGLPRIAAVADARNQASLQLLKHLGMRQVADESRPDGQVLRRHLADAPLR